MEVGQGCVRGQDIGHTSPTVHIRYPCHRRSEDRDFYMIRGQPCPI